MKWNFLFLSVLLLAAILAGCGSPAPVAKEIPETDPNPQSPENSETSITMSGINLYMHRPFQNEGIPVKPELWVKADSFSIEEERIYSFENASAVLYGKNAEDEITLNALRGRFEQDKFAVLEGEIKMTAGSMKILLSDLTWSRPEENAPGMAQSKNPVVVDDPDLQLNASGLRLFPDERTFEFDNVSGVVRFGKEMP